MPTFNSSGFDIYYEVHGKGAGDPLLYITGLGGSCQVWNIVTVPELKTDRRNILFEIPNQHIPRPRKKRLCLSVSTLCRNATCQVFYASCGTRMRLMAKNIIRQYTHTTIGIQTPW